MDPEGKILLIPDKPDEERDAVATAWRDLGGEVIHLARFWEPPPLKCESVCVYGGSNFALVVAQKLGLDLISPADDWLLGLDRKWLKRILSSHSLADVNSISFPTFIKPIVPKIFRAAVFVSPEALDQECKGLAPDTRILVSEVVRFQAEARAFVANQQLLDCQIYEGSRELPGAPEFILSLLQETPLPVTCVIDVGLIPEKGWAVVEANASWGAGLNGCDARRVLPAIALATKARQP